VHKKANDAHRHRSWSWSVGRAWRGALQWLILIHTSIHLLPG